MYIEKRLITQRVNLFSTYLHHAAMELASADGRDQSFQMEAKRGVCSVEAGLKELRDLRIFNKKKSKQK